MSLPSNFTKYIVWNPKLGKQAFFGEYPEDAINNLCFPQSPEIAWPVLREAGWILQKFQNSEDGEQEPFFYL